MRHNNNQQKPPVNGAKPEPELAPTPQAPSTGQTKKRLTIEDIKPEDMIDGEWIPIVVAAKLLPSRRALGTVALESVYRWTKEGQLSYRDYPSPTGHKNCRWVKLSEIKELLTPIKEVTRRQLPNGAEEAAMIEAQRLKQMELDAVLRRHRLI